MQAKKGKQVFRINFCALCTKCTKVDDFFWNICPYKKKKTLSYNLGELKVIERGIGWQ